MRSDLADRNFTQALESAGNSELTTALHFTAIALGAAPTDEKSWRLSGLCYYQLGIYPMASHCFAQLVEEQTDYLLAIERKQKEMLAVTTLTLRNEYKRAVRCLAEMSDKKVGEWNYLGCLYAVLGKKEKALDCFTVALKMDHSNKDAKRYIYELLQDKTKKWWQIWR